MKQASEKLAVFGGAAVMPQGMTRTRWPRWTAAEIAEIGRVLEYEQLFGTDAPQVKLLEQEWGARLGVDYCTAVSSGTAALHTALWAAGVQPGDEVLVPAYSFMATEANRVVQETSMVAEAPTAAGPEIIDYLAAGFRKVFSQIDEVLKIRLSEPLSRGGLANRDEILARAMAANA